MKCLNLSTRSSVSRPIASMATIICSTLILLSADQPKDESTRQIVVGKHSSSQYGSNIADLALIYAGGSNRLPWTAEQLSPYVSYSTENKEYWLFDGFLFLEFRAGAYEYSHGFGLKDARKLEWVKLLDTYFDKNHCIPALDQVCSQASKRIHTAADPRHVVIMIPQPVTGQTDWGEIDGKQLDFSKPDDRIAACFWYIDEVIRRWETLSPANLELSGFYWLAESAKADANILPAIASKIHSNNKYFYWIPYWNSPGASEWRSYGFDIAYQQPNHFFETKIPDKRLYDACSFALKQKMAIEVEFDRKIISKTDAFMPRLYQYLNTFQQQGFRNGSPIAYYDGGGALLDLFNSKDPKLHQMYDDIATWIYTRNHTSISKSIK